MEHAREIELIELAAQRLAAGREKTVLAHLEICPACRGKWQDIRKTWDLLGAWQVDMAGRGAGPGAHQERPVSRVIRFPGIRMAARLAAAIAVSVLLGYAGGRWSIHPTAPRPGWEPPSYFSVLESEIGDSFSSLVLQDEPSARQEG